MAGVGFRFRPSDEALIGVLERKRRNPLYDVRESTRFNGDMSEMYMYGPGKEPWNLFSGIHEITELSETNDPKRKIREKYVGVLKNLDKCCNIKFGTKRCRQDDEQDFQPATKRSRHFEEESQASGSCSENVEEEVEDPQEYYTEAIDFSDPDNLDFDPEELLSNIPDMLGQNQEDQAVHCPEMQSMNDECSGPVYVPDMSGFGQNQEKDDEFGNFSEMLQSNWGPGCSSAMPAAQGSSADEWSVEALMKLIPS